MSERRYKKTQKEIEENVRNKYKIESNKRLSELRYHVGHIKEYEDLLEGSVEGRTFKNSLNQVEVNKINKEEFEKKIEEGNLKIKDKYEGKNFKTTYIKTDNGFLINRDFNEDERKHWETFDKSHRDFRFNLEDFEKETKYTAGINSGTWISKEDNEDPILFGFEVKIKSEHSPLLNDELLKFILRYNKLKEINDRLKILEKFKIELSKYFELSSISKVDIKGNLLTQEEANNGPVGIGGGKKDDVYIDDSGNVFIKEQFSDGSRWIPSGIDSLIGSDKYITNKKYYLKKIDGLDKLVEKNTWFDKNKPFVKYDGTELITLTFVEDTTLNIGTLISLYKTLYWDRLKGKNPIPENLLKFDCQIIVSEVRNFVKHKKEFYDKSVVVDDDLLDEEDRSFKRELEKNRLFSTLYKSKVTKYVYNLYECQFWMDSLSHPASIDMGTEPKTNDATIKFSYKYSDLSFEKYSDSSGEWTKIKNGHKEETNGNNYLTFKVEQMERLLGNVRPSIEPFIEKDIPPLFEVRDVPPEPPNPEGKPQNIYKTRFIRPLDPAGFIKRRVGVVKAIAIGELQKKIATLTPLLTNALNRIREGIGFKKPNVYRGDIKSGKLKFSEAPLEKFRYSNSDIDKSKSRSVSGVVGDKRVFYDTRTAILRIPNGIRKPNVPVYAADIGSAIYSLVDGVNPPNNIY
jgi:hypothetical protein